MTTFKDRENIERALDNVQNLLGAFDNPIMKRKCSNEFTQQAINEAQAFINEMRQKPEYESYFKNSQDASFFFNLNKEGE